MAPVKSVEPVERRAIHTDPVALDVLDLACRQGRVIRRYDCLTPYADCATEHDPWCQMTGVWYYHDGQLHVKAEDGGLAACAEIEWPELRWIREEVEVASAGHNTERRFETYRVGGVGEVDAALAAMARAGWAPAALSVGGQWGDHVAVLYERDVDGRVLRERAARWTPTLGEILRLYGAEGTGDGAR